MCGKCQVGGTSLVSSQPELEEPGAHSSLGRVRKPDQMKTSESRRDDR